MPRSRPDRSPARSLHRHRAVRPRAARVFGNPAAPLGRLARDAGGITFVEVLVAAVLLVLAVGALLPMLTVSQQSWEVAPPRMAMIQNARVAIDRIVREMRAAETFEELTGSTLRFTMYAGGRPVTTSPAWWNTAWPYRRRITAAAGSTAAASGYSVLVTVDHAALVAGGKSLASGNDVRLLYWTGASWVELDRFLNVPSAWNTASTAIWFRLQAGIGASSTDSNYYLYYGNLSAGAPPANGDNVFLDYEDGSSLSGWTDRDSCAGTYSATADGFHFTASSGNCHRQFSKALSHSDIEIFWGFWSDPSGASDGHQTGMSARRSDSGVGYVLTLADETNATLRIRYWTVWTTTGGAIASVSAAVTPGTNYYGRFYLVGSSIRAKYWAVGAAEPGWMVTASHTGASSGLHYGQVDGYASPMTHRHRTIIVRQRRADPEPTTTLDSESSILVMTVEYRLDAASGELEYRRGTDPWQPLAGPFQSPMGVTCFDAANATISCTPASAVRSVEITLVAVDPTGVITTPITITSRAYRQVP